MRILIVNRHDSFERMGGDTIQMLKTAQYLKKIDVDVDIAIGPQAVSTYKQYEIAHILNLQTPSFTNSEILKAKEGNCKIALSPIWWDFRPDEILRDAKKWAAIRKLLGTSLARKILIARISSNFPEGDSTLKDILRECDAILPNSCAELEAVRKLGKYNAKEFLVVNGVEASASADVCKAASLLRKYGISEHGFIMIAARVEPVKNQLRYVQAVQTLGIPVLCAGAINQGYGDQCLSAGAVLVGQQDASVLNGLYALCRVHALPSLRETPGLASLEAALCGASIITTNIGSAREYFSHHAEYLDPHEPRSMLAATVRALNRPKSTHLRSRVIEKYTWENAAFSTLVAYRSLLEEQA